MEINLDYLGGPKVITGVLISKRGGTGESEMGYVTGSRNQRDSVAGRKGSSSKVMQLIEAGEDKETDSPLKTPERMQLCQHIDFRLLTSRALRK